jgi:tRNA (guanine37-N1)-methyltransferase
MNFHVLTLFPDMILGGLNTSITGRAIQKGVLSVHAVNIRDFSKDLKHFKVDDYPYGGGAGLVMQPEPVCDAYESVVSELGYRPRCVYMTPQGHTFNQKMAEDFSKEKDLCILCGHYEGIDERALEKIVTDYVSIGDYVLTGGELPAMVVVDTVSRLVPGVLGNMESAETESFGNGLLEYPQYTRPAEYDGMRVPDILLSGNHAKVDEWRLAQSIERTKKYRPDLYEEYMKGKE